MLKEKTEPMVNQSPEQNEMGFDYFLKVTTFIIKEIWNDSK